MKNNVLNETVLYQKTRLGKTQVWRTWVSNKNTKSGHPEVWIEHGQIDGVKQLTHDIITDGVNIGKSNETTPLDQALLILERRVTKQLESGYSKDPPTDSDYDVDFSERMPKELCFYKPKNSIDQKKLDHLDSLGNAIYTVKRDGMMHVVRKTKLYGVEIYTRRMDLVTDNYPHLVRELLKVPHDDFILLGEIILDNSGADNFNGVSQICRSDPDKAIDKQKDLGLVSYYIFDIPYFNGKYNNSNIKYTDRLKLIDKYITSNTSNSIMRCETINANNKDALSIVKKRKLEGLVVWDASGLMNKNECLTMNGKAYRPNVLFKLKPKYEDDFIVRFDPDNDVGEYGSGKNHGKIKSVHLYQIDDSGEEIFISKCGGGLSDEQRDFYTSAKYPRVWRIEYDSIQSKTGSLRFPVFISDRTISGDKTINECHISDAIKQARQEEDDNE